MLPIPNEDFEPMIVFTATSKAQADDIAFFCKLHNLPLTPVRVRDEQYGYIAHATAFGPLLFNDLMIGIDHLLYIHPRRSRNLGRQVDKVSIARETLKQPCEEIGRWFRVSEATAKANDLYFHGQNNAAYYVVIPDGNTARKLAKGVKKGLEGYNLTME